MLIIKNAMQQRMELASLVEMLDKRLKGYEEPRSHKTIHASALTNQETTFCAREYALLHVTKKKQKPRFIATAVRVAFDNGNALSELCRNKWLKDDVVGSWECMYCKHTLSFSKRPLVKCAGCGAKDMWQYKEEEFVDPVSGVSGSIDFFIDFQTSKHTPVECKSMAKDEFKDLIAPKAEHLVRTECYLELIDRSKRPEAKQVDTSFGKVLYISKGFGAKHVEFNRVLPFKEFNVVRNPKRAASYLEMGQRVTDFLKGGPMPRGVCPSALAPRAKHCSMVSECFSGEYPVGKVA